MSGLVTNYRDESLARCPFCGEYGILTKIIVSEKGKPVEKWYVGCSADKCCELETSFKSREQATIAWNMRIAF